MNEILKLWEKIRSWTWGGKIDADLSGSDEAHIRKKISECVFAKGGEISSRSRAVELGQIYIKLSKKGQEKFMKILARDFAIDNEKVSGIIETFRGAKDEDSRTLAELELSKALIPPRVRLLKQFSELPNGFKFLINFREDLLPLRKSDPYLRKLDADLINILSSWFDIGLLDLKDITWQSPASLLEKLIKYEAVHEIRSWADLKNRLDSDRQCFAFFHNKMPEEPLIFVEVALVNEMTESIRELLDEEAATMKPEEADTAVFYSISNAQKGLVGISLGNFLIKRVVKVLSNKLKGLKHFVTLSPIPRFRKWLDPLLLDGDESLLTPAEIKILKFEKEDKNASRSLFRHLNSDWYNKNGLARTLKPILMRLCAHYLMEVKKGDKAFDPVANFHLANGARIERLNWFGDISPKGFEQSAGMMVNYYYDLSEIERNHEFYITESQINVSKDVRKWLKK